MSEKKKRSTLDLVVCVLAVVASLVQFFLAYAFEGPLSCNVPTARDRVSERWRVSRYQNRRRSRERRRIGQVVFQGANDEVFPLG
jgi:hypothetical protein